MTSQAAERRLLQDDCSVGDFLVRSRSSKPDVIFFAALESVNVVRHHEVERTGTHYIRSDGTQFSSLDEFVQHHRDECHVFACKLGNWVAANA